MLRLKGMESVIHQEPITSKMSDPKVKRFREFVTRIHPAAMRLCILLLGSHQSMAEDIVQKAALSAWRHLDSQHSDRQMPAWFRRIVINEVRSYFRWQGARRRLMKLFGETLVKASEPAEPDHGLRTRLADALDQLSLRQREVFVLVYLNDLKLAEAATIVGCAEGTAKVHLHRAVKQLRSDLIDVWSES